VFTLSILSAHQEYHELWSRTRNVRKIFVIPLFETPTLRLNKIVKCLHVISEQNGTAFDRQSCWPHADFILLFYLRWEPV